MALTNNDVLKKLRVALELRDDDILDILKLVDFEISKSELGAFFRRYDHPKYMECKDQVLRNFLNGLVIYKRGPRDGKPGESKPKRSAVPDSFKRNDDVARKEKPRHGAGPNSNASGDEKPKKKNLVLTRRKPGPSA